MKIIHVRVICNDRILNLLAVLRYGDTAQITLIHNYKRSKQRIKENEIILHDLKAQNKIKTQRNKSTQ